MQNLRRIFCITKTYVFETYIPDSLRYFQSYMMFQFRFIGKKGPYLIYIHTVLICFRGNLGKSAHSAPQTSRAVKQYDRIAVINRAEYCRLKDKIDNIQPIQNKISRQILLRKHKAHTFSRHLFVNLLHLIVRFFKFFLQHISHIRVKTKFFRIIIEIEQTADIISLALIRIDFHAHLIIYFIEYFRQKEIEYKRDGDKQDSNHIRHQIKHARSNYYRKALHYGIEQFQKAVYRTFRFGYRQHKLIIVLRIVIARQIQFRRFLVHFLFQRLIKFRAGTEIHGIDKITIRQKLRDINEQDNPNDKKCFPKRLAIFGTVQDILNTYRMFQKDNHLLAKSVKQKIQHIPRRYAKTKLP